MVAYSLGLGGCDNPLHPKVRRLFQPPLVHNIWLYLRFARQFASLKDFDKYLASEKEHGLLCVGRMSSYDESRFIIKLRDGRA